MARQRDPLPYGLLRGFGGTVYAFDAGTVSLQLVATGGEAERAVFETLHAPDDLVRWLAGSPLAVDPATAEVSDADLAAVKRLREALWEISTRRARDAAVPATYLRTLNEAAAAPPLVPAIAADGTRRWAAPATGSAICSTLARDAIDLLTGPAGGRIRQCAGDTCALVFVDTSRPGRRRWCSMTRCGNLHKQRVHRARASDPGPEAPAGPA